MEHEGDGEVPIAVGALGIVPKCLERILEELETRGKMETIQTTPLLRLARILRRDLKRLAVTHTPVKPPADA